MGPLFEEKDDILSLQSKVHFKVKAKPLLTQASKMKQSLITNYFQKAQEPLNYLSAFVKQLEQKPAKKASVNIANRNTKTKPSNLST